MANRRKGLNKNVSFKDQQLPAPPIKRNTSYQDTVIKFIEEQTEEKSTEKPRKWSNECRSCSKISEKAEDEFCTYNTEYYV